MPHEKSKVITTEAFWRYKEQALTKELNRELNEVCNDYLSNGQVCIRTAYFAPKETNLLFPRSQSLISQKQCLAFIRKVWDFFIKNKMYGPQAENNLIIENFGPRFASGTFITSTTQRRPFSFIEVIYGIWEGIQGNIHDVYTVDLKDKKILYKDVPKKEKVFSPIAVGRWKYQKVPQELAARQIMPDEQILKLASYGSLVEKNFGPKQIEFFVLHDALEKPQRSMDETILLWHITDVSRLTKAPRYFNVVPQSEKILNPTKIIFQGRLTKIEEISQVGKIKLTNETILYIDSNIIAKRDPLLINLIGKFAAEHSLPVLYKGGVLSHVFTILSEFGILIFPVNESVDGFSKVKIICKESYNA